MKTPIKKTFKQQGITISQLAKLLKVSRPTVYAYMNRYDSNDLKSLPKRVKTLFSSFESPLLNEHLLPLDGDVTSTNKTYKSAYELKRKLIKKIEKLPTSQIELLDSIRFLVDHKHTIDIVTLISKINRLISKHSPSRLIESEVNTFVDYLIHKHDEDTKM
jgi:transcriptional regulator with XRE-family HTH domain